MLQRRLIWMMTKSTMNKFTMLSLVEIIVTDPRTTRSGRRVYSPQRMIASASIRTSRAQENLSRGLRHLFEQSLAHICFDQICDLDEMVATGEFSQLPEFDLVGMCIGGGFNNTEELHVLTYEQAMQSSHHREWDDAVEQEQNRMLQHGVFVPIRIEDMPTCQHVEIFTRRSSYEIKQT
jgi:hypothetical protein